jgi:asparagine synthase (glutamine-hydrolysing)
MLETICHESFYEAGTWNDESLGVYVAWAAHKNSFSSGMPLLNEQGDVCLVFSGEEYSKPGTACRLKERGHSPDPEGPSYLVHLYEEDARFPAGLNGIFHGLVVDRTRGRAMLFNDRYGMHRLYFHESKDGFYFAAEAKSILAVRPELRTADYKGLGEFVAYNCVLDNRTIFKDIHVLPAASAWIIRNGSVESTDTYFEPRQWENQPVLDPDYYYQELQDVLSRSLPRYFAGRERVGMALTGGLDTRVIMTWYRPTSGSLPCYTFGSAYRDCQDVQIARQVATACGQSYEVIPIGEDFLSRFAYYAERTVYLTEGGVNLYFSPDLYASERAREIAPAKVVGTYGSEIVRQAVMFKPMDVLPGLFRPEFVPYIRQAGDTYARIRSEHPVTFAAFRQSPWYHHGILSLEQSQLTVRSPFLDNDFVRTVYRAPKPDAADGDVRLRLIRSGSPPLSRLRSDRGVGGNSGRLLRAFWRSLLEFTFKAEYAYDYGMPQWVAQVDHLLSPLHLERLFLGRHKFIHFRVWYRDALSEYVRQILLDSRTLSRPYLERNAVDAVVNGHLKGGRNYTTEIHKLLTLELLHRLFFDAN